MSHNIGSIQSESIQRALIKVPRKFRLPVLTILRQAADLFDAQAAELEKLRAIANAAGDLDADNVRTMDGMPLGVVVPKFVIDRIQEAWMDWKGVKHEQQHDYYARRPDGM